jgi:hypothetical protein
MRRLIALTTVVAALGVGATSATAAAPTAFEQFQKLCFRQGGSVFVGGGFPLRCIAFSFTDRDLAQAQRLCLRNEGTFVGSSGEYSCDGL